MEASRAEFDSPDVREGKGPSALFDRPLLKYVGFALLLAWHYVLWFVPSFFFHTQLLDESVTLSWVASLLATAAFLFVLAGLLGRKRHLSDYPAVLPAAMIVAAASTVALGFFPFHLAPAGLYLVVIIALSASEATLWILWGERYACVKANFTINHIGTVFGITLFLCVLIASRSAADDNGAGDGPAPPGIGSPSGLRPQGRKARLSRTPAAQRYKQRLQEHARRWLRHAARLRRLLFPQLHHPMGSAAHRRGLLHIRHFGRGSVHSRHRRHLHAVAGNRLNIFKIYPALLIAIMVGFSLFLSSTFAYFPAFIVGIGVQSLFEVLLIMYFGILTTKGYATPALTFAMAGGFVRLGLAAGNSLALWYESMAVPVTQALTPPTCLAFMCLLAVVLVPLVRMEFSIVALTAAPPTRNEVEEICAEAAAEFGLSAREAEILLLIARGHTTNSMAEKLVISPYTVNTHIRHIYDKMQIHKRSELLNYLNMQRSDF